MGKTFAFGVPLLQRITAGTAARPLSGAPRALVVVPTRELCIQVTADLTLAAKYLSAEDGRRLSVVSIYGGRPYEPQVEALRAGADVVVGTPGRLLDLCQQGFLQLGGLSVLVLDEADEMLDLGFLPDIERIRGRSPPTGNPCCSRRPCRTRSLPWRAPSWCSPRTSGPRHRTRRPPTTPPSSSSTAPTRWTRWRW